jgi:hypothetical protein
MYCSIVEVLTLFVRIYLNILLNIIQKELLIKVVWNFTNGRSLKEIVIITSFARIIFTIPRTFPYNEVKTPILLG